MPFRLPAKNVLSLTSFLRLNQPKSVSKDRRNVMCNTSHRITAVLSLLFPRNLVNPHFRFLTPVIMLQIEEKNLNSVSESGVTV